MNGTHCHLGGNSVSVEILRRYGLDGLLLLRQ
jgi:hypothetical protein